MAFVSVIVPTYNSRAFIDRAVDSALGQSRPVDQIVLIDDQSKDGTFDYLRDRYGANPVVTVLQTPKNGGPSAARNLGIEAATGDFIAVLDADDAWSETRNADFFNLIGKEAPDFAADNILLYDGALGAVTRPGFADDGSVKAISAEDLFLNDIITQGRFNYGVLKPYLRRSFLDAHGLRYDESLRYGEDFKLYAELLFHGGNAVLSSKPGYLYTTRMGDVSGVHSDQSRTSARFDILHATSVALRTQHAERITPPVERAMRTREDSLLVIHESNVAREYRRSGNLLRYGLYVLSKPKLIALLLGRQLRRFGVR